MLHYIEVLEDERIDKTTFVRKYNLPSDVNTIRDRELDFENFDLVSEWRKKTFEGENRVSLKKGKYLFASSSSKTDFFYNMIHEKLDKIFNDSSYLETSSAIDNVLQLLKEIENEVDDYLIYLTMAICYFHIDQYCNSNCYFEMAINSEGIPGSFIKEITYLQEENSRRNNLVSTRRILFHSPKNILFIACDGDIESAEYSWQFKLLKSIYESDDLDHIGVSVNKNKVVYIQTPYMSSLNDVISQIKSRKPDGIVVFMHSSNHKYSIWLDENEIINNIDLESQDCYENYRKVFNIPNDSFLIIMGCDSQNIGKRSPLAKTIGSTTKTNLGNLYPFLYSFFKSQLFQNDWLQSYNIAKVYSRFFSENAIGFIRKK